MNTFLIPSVDAVLFLRKLVSTLVTKYAVDDLVMA
jgi:hypothetical protein